MATAALLPSSQVRLIRTTARSYTLRRKIISPLHFSPTQLAVGALFLANGLILAAFIIGAMALLVVVFFVNLVPIATWYFLRRTGFSSNADFSSYSPGGWSR